MKKLFVLITILVIFLIGSLVWWNNGLSAVNAQDSSQKMFLITPGAGVRAIANDLKEEGLIRDPIVFFLYTKQTGIDQRIQAGDFRLSPSMSARDIAQELTTGMVDIWITIPEGKRAEEVATILKENIPTYEDSWEEELKAQEGYLFPETYLIPRDATVESIITLLRNTFEEKYNSIETNNVDLTREEVVILASMIEREVRHTEDLPIVSSIMHNRLEINMPLQIDATIQYAKGENNGKWWEPVTLEEYKSVKSDYNTYLSYGLPPGPIASPGLNALSAAVNPADTDYLYYITDQTGTNRYAKTYEQHQANIDRFGL